jgi:hypothetical protein
MDDRIRNAVKRHVEYSYHIEEIHCTATMLKFLSKIFGIELHNQVMDAALGMHGAGLYGAQCGLVEGSLMFIGLLGKSKGIEGDVIEELCYKYAEGFERRLGSLLCRELRPEGFKDSNPPHLCEPRTVDAVLYTIEYITGAFDLKTDTLIGNL